MTFDDQWQRLVQAAREAPETPSQTLDVERIVASRRLHLRPSPLSPPSRTVRIGWFPPGLAAAAVMAGICAFLAGIDPRAAAFDAGVYLADLPRQVPRAPAFSAPAFPSAARLMDDMIDQSTRFIPFSTETSP